MELEQPKVQTNEKNLNEDQEKLILAYEVFEKSEAGKKLLKKLKEYYISDKYNGVIFPRDMQLVLRNFGSVEVYAGYRSGQASVIFAIEHLIEAYKHMDDKQPEKIIVK